MDELAISGIFFFQKDGCIFDCELSTQDYPLK